MRLRESGEIGVKPGEIAHHPVKRQICELTVIVHVFHVFLTVKIEWVIDGIFEAIELQGLQTELGAKFNIERGSRLYPRLIQIYVGKPTSSKEIDMA